jgi:hypothetical protein
MHFSELGVQLEGSASTVFQELSVSIVDLTVANIRFTGSAKLFPFREF